MNAKRAPHLTLVPSGLKKLALREQLIARAKTLFPGSQTLAAQWVEAKLLLGDRKPDVDIGIQRIDTSRTARALPIGSIAEPLEIPAFLRRLVKP